MNQTNTTKYDSFAVEYDVISDIIDLKTIVIVVSVYKIYSSCIGHSSLVDLVDAKSTIFNRFITTIYLHKQDTTNFFI